MKKLEVQLKAVAKELGKLSKQVEKVAAQAAKQNKVKPAPKKRAVKKAAPKKAAKATAKKAAPAKAAKKSTVLDSVYDVVRRARNGATIAQLKQKTGLNPRQLSNALYKLSTRAKIMAKSRGVYVKK